MENQPIYQREFDNHRCCVLIPTYNNHSTLQRVIDQVLHYTRNLVVVNDGSTDGTAEILKSYSHLDVVTLPENKGKGNALKVGFKAAGAKGYQYAISMDSDGQHFPNDLPVFLEALENHHSEDCQLLVIGSRKMDGPDVPEKSSIGNRWSSFWFRVVTGIHLSDTQCGYRLYPLKVVNGLHLMTSKFELEIEVIVKAAWRGVKVINLPVKVLYDPEERVTHFRPFQDVARITLLNICFVGMALFYYRPRQLFKKKKPVKREQKKTFSNTKVPLE